VETSFSFATFSINASNNIFQQNRPRGNRDAGRRNGIIPTLKRSTNTRPFLMYPIRPIQNKFTLIFLMIPSTPLLTVFLSARIRDIPGLKRALTGRRTLYYHGRVGRGLILPDKDGFTWKEEYRCGGLFLCGFVNGNRKDRGNQIMVPFVFN
jgi:hypothetical protein